VKDTIPKYSILELWPKTLPIEECDSGLWLGTPMATEQARSSRFAEGRTPNPSEFVKEHPQKMWLTPNAMDSLEPRTPEALQKQYEKNRKGRTTHSTLREQVCYPPPQKMWPTPVASDSARGPISEERYQKKLGGPSLISEVQHRQKMWPTPNTSDAYNANMKDDHDIKKGYLRGVVKMWPTPTANEDACGKPTGKMQKMLGNHPDVRNTGKGSLNPDWVEHYLMGYPKDWTKITG